MADSINVNVICVVLQRTRLKDNGSFLRSGSLQLFLCHPCRWNHFLLITWCLQIGLYYCFESFSSYCCNSYWSFRCNVMWCKVISCNIMQVIQCDAMWCKVLSCNITQCNVTSTSTDCQKLTFIYLFIFYSVIGWKAQLPLGLYSSIPHTSSLFFFFFAFSSLLSLFCFSFLFTSLSALPPL